MRAALAALPPETAAERSSAIVARLRTLPELARARAVCAYAPVAEWNEVDIGDLARSLIHAGVRLAAPSVDAGAAWISDWDNGLVPADALRTHLPRAGSPAADPLEIDAIIVPGLAFDARGGRLGRGGGWYDRFLTHLPPESARIAVAFDVQVVDGVPVGPHDQRVGLIVTESRIIRTPPA